MQQAGYSPDDLASMTAAFEKANPNIKVNNTLVSYDALHDKIVAAAPAGTYDVVLGDVIWPPEFGSRGIVRDITDKVKTLPTSQIFPGALIMADYKDKYYGMPWILDTKYMFANGSMLKKAGVTPADLKTWDGVVAALKKIKAKGIVKYPWLGSWKQAEAVVCDYAQLLGAFGGKFLDASGKPAFQTGGGLQALQFMKMMLDQGLADPASTTSDEAAVLKAFAQGHIALNLNWTFQLAGALDPKQSLVSKDDPAHSGGLGRWISSGLQRRPAGHDHDGQQASRRGVGVHQVHHQPADSESARDGLAADLGGVVQRLGRDQASRLAARRCRQDRASQHDPAAAGDQLQRCVAGAPSPDPERTAGQEEPAGRA
jgi:ABC-type glycerol-3-phosphate transport system substrate-binding protein